MEGAFCELRTTISSTEGRAQEPSRVRPCRLAQAFRMREPLAMSTPNPVLAPDVALELNPLLDRKALAQGFARGGRLHIPDVLTQASAVRLFQALQQETPWTVTLNKGPNFLDFERMPPEERGKLAMGVFE